MKFLRFAVLAIFASLVLGADKPLKQLLKQAQKAETAGDLGQAYLLYSQAAAKDPSNQILWTHAQMLRPLANLKQPAPATPEAANAKPAEAASEADPTILGEITGRDLLVGQTLAPPPELIGPPGTKDLDARGDSKGVFEQVAAAFGFRVIFDSAYQPKNMVRLQLTDVTYREALRALEAATDSFIVPVGAHLLLVANDSTQKRAELDHTASVVIPVPEPVSIQEIQEIATGVRGILDIQRLMVDSQRRMILIRDRVSKVALAEKIIEDLMRPKAQVAVEVELISVDESSSLQYGLSLPNSFSLIWLAQSNRLTATIPVGFSNYLGFGGGKSFIGIGLANASLFAVASRSHAKTILTSEVVTSDGQPASLHIGDKYPIITSGYFGTSTGTGTVYTPPPNITFEDLGLSLKVTPRVHGVDEVSLDLETEFKLLGSTSVDGIPVISNRKFQSKVRVSTGEWAVIAGLVANTDSETISGLAGLSVIPLLRSNTKTRTHNEILVVLKPHLLSLPPTEMMVGAAWVGTETRPRTAL